MIYKFKLMDNSMIILIFLMSHSRNMFHPFEILFVIFHVRMFQSEIFTQLKILDRIRNCFLLLWYNLVLYIVHSDITSKN